MKVMPQYELVMKILAKKEEASKHFAKVWEYDDNTWDDSLSEKERDKFDDLSQIEYEKATECLDDLNALLNNLIATDNFYVEINEN